MVIELWESKPHATNTQLAELAGMKPAAVGAALRAAGITPALRVVAKRRYRMIQRSDREATHMLTAVIVAAKLKRLGRNEVAIAGHFGITWPQWLSFKASWAKELGYD